jgi:hypothetical protein
MTKTVGSENIFRRWQRDCGDRKKGGGGRKRELVRFQIAKRQEREKDIIRFDDGFISFPR